jgi:DNA-binding NtrC family response regulator
VRKVRDELGGIPAILMTGHEVEDIAASQLELHATCILKPFDVDALVAAIHRSLTERA